MPKSANNFEEKYKGLNDNQKIAVDSINSQVLCLAGPGSGKTFTISMRIANILHKTQSRPENILAVTFTESAAFNMRDRLIKLIGEDAYSVRISTFHGFANDIIKTFPDFFLKFNAETEISDFKIKKIIKEIMESIDLEYLKPGGSADFYLKDVQSRISTLKREGIDSGAFKSILENLTEEDVKQEKLNINRLMDLQSVFCEYEKVLKDSKFYDYDDMINLASIFFRENTEEAKKQREQFEHILVDEYQDTNNSQNDLLFALAGDEPNLFVVGDDDQAIYKFQGASNDNFLKLQSRYPLLQIVQLSVSYRYGEDISILAGGIVENSASKEYSLLSKDTRTLADKRSNRPQVLEFETADSENAFIFKKVQELLAAGVNPSDIVILYFKHSQAVILQKMFQKNGVPFTSAMTENVFNKQIIKEIFIVLDYILNPDDSKLFSLFLVSFLKLDPCEYLSKISQGTQKLIKDPGSVQDILLKLSTLVSDLSAPASAGLFKIIEEFELNTLLYEKQDFTEMLALKTFYEFGVELSLSGYSLADFIKEIVDLKGSRDGISYVPVKQEGVNFSTIHSAKGLEFEHVFLIQANASNFKQGIERDNLRLPSSITIENPALRVLDMDEKRRLLFVAITRAKLNLTVSYSIYKKDIYKKTQSELTPFLVGLDSLYDFYSFKTSDNLKTAKLEKLAVENLFFKVQPPLSSEFHEYLKTRISNISLSATSMTVYISCPRRFMFEKLLKIPQEVSLNLILGSAVHKALEIFGKAQKSGDEFLDDQGVISSKVQSQMQAGAESIIDLSVLKKSDVEFLKKDVKNKISFFSSDPIKTIPYSVEELKYNIFFEGIRLTGKIDRIELKDQLATVVDFKTTSSSAIKTKNKVMGNTKSEDDYYTQLSFYDILLGADVRFLFKVSDFILFFLGNDGTRKILIQKEELSVDIVKQQIKEVDMKIKNLEFDKKALPDSDCSTCPFKNYCWDELPEDRYLFV